jgi:hypothetical protein
VLRKMPDAAERAAASRSASANTRFADLPPSSRETFFRFRPAISATRRPVSLPPVNAMRSTPGCSIRAVPVEPSPVITLTTPRGKPALATSSVRRSGASGASSEGLRTMALPAARAGASLNTDREIGAFHGMIAATTPIGSRSV